MLIIGSQALVRHFPHLERTPKDWDYICTFEEFQKWTKAYGKDNMQKCVPLSGDKFHVLGKDGMNYEFEIAWPGSSGALLLEVLDAESGEVICPVSWLYALKMSHRYLKNSPHFLKTMQDIQFLRNHITKGEERVVFSAWFKQRELETYTYSHPKLDVSKGEFFAGDGVQYVYDHDSIHEAVAYGTRPAYKWYMKDGSEVMTSKEKFFHPLNEEVRLYGVYEEACVLALERSQIPYPNTPARKSFEMALMKVCTSITSGWFREYAWENYDKVMDLYELMGEDDYLQRFMRNAHMLKPHTEQMM